MLLALTAGVFLLFLCIAPGSPDGGARADVVLDVIGGDILKRSTALVRAGARSSPRSNRPRSSPENGRAIFFVVEADCSQLSELAQRLRDGRTDFEYRAVRPFAEAPAASGPDAPHVSGKTIIQVIEGW